MQSIPWQFLDIRSKRHGRTANILAIPRSRTSTFERCGNTVLAFVRNAQRIHPPYRSTLAQYRIVMVLVLVLFATNPFVKSFHAVPSGTKVIVPKSNPERRCEIHTLASHGDSTNLPPTEQIHVFEIQTPLPSSRERIPSDAVLQMTGVRIGLGDDAELHASIVQFGVFLVEYSTEEIGWSFEGLEFIGEKSKVFVRFEPKEFRYCRWTYSSVGLLERRR
mmetsp:Transcript_36000/g.52766  ORF Transcript_36000/g.52766 Transcript_36000/m.52766 type:complete len:220 (+) Transcript_36000:406-1065(+)